MAKKIFKKGKLKKVIAKIKAKAVKTLKGAGENIALAPLVPLLPVMLIALKRNNIKHSKKVSDIALKFYRHVIFKGKHFDGYNIGDSSDVSGLVYDPEIAKQAGDSGEESKPEKINKGMFVTMIQAILYYIRKIKKKKEKGEALTQEEKTILDAYTPIETSIEDTVKDLAEENIAEKIKDFIFSPAGIIIIIIIIGGLIYVFLIKK